MAEMGASVALQRLRDLGGNENEIKEVADHVMSLVSMRRMLHWALSHSNLIQTFFQKKDTFRVVAYTIEDVLDTFVVDVTVMLQKNETWSSKIFLEKVSPVLVNIEKDILELTILVISAIRNIPHKPRVASQGPPGIEEHFVGMNDELVKLVSMVPERNSGVISIWGETGLGKTTIAGKIYKHRQLMKRFEAFAWVCLSQGCETKTIFLNILRQLISPKPVNETTQEETLREQLKSVLSKNRCLIVLDNVQDMDHRIQLSDPDLQMKLGHSVILLTTREKIADVGSPHKLRLLNQDEAWNLLKKHAFPRNDAPDVGCFTRLRKEMVQKCGYLPLAISRLGKIFSSENYLHDCKDIQGNQIEGHEQSESSLDSKYANLPYYLKLCFLHLGIFSKGEEIDVEDLYFLWIAEGIVSSLNEDTEEPAMNRAEKYLTELASREVVKVQRDELSATRRSQPCFLFTPVQELLSWEEEKKEICLKIVDCCNGRQPMPSSFSFSNEIRRLAIHFNKQLEKIGQLSQHDLRSVFLLNTGNQSVELPLETTAFGKFKLLRILNFVNCKFDGRKLPEGIDKLLNLRYLGLLYCDLDELPLSIGNLRNLRLLNVRVLENCRLRIPQVFNKLDLLNHLRLPYCAYREQTQKVELGDLLELETLFGFNSLIHNLDSLSKLKKLRLLGAHAYSNDSLQLLLGFITSHGARVRTKLFIENKCNFTSKEGVVVLGKVLMCPNLHALTLSMVSIDRVPDCGNQVSSNLTELKLIGCRITKDPMGALGKFPNLQKLCLGHGAFVGIEMTVQANGFPKLAYLEIRSLPNFEKWWVDKGAMPNLSDLIIQRCPRLKMVPDGLRSISNLKNLEIELAPEAFAKVSEEEYRQKFQFVPTRNIRKVDPCSTS